MTKESITTNWLTIEQHERLAEALMLLCVFVAGVNLGVWL